MSLADAKVIVQGSRAKSVVHVTPPFPNCIAPTTHTIFKELGKTGNYQKVQNMTKAAFSSFSME